MIRRCIFKARDGSVFLKSPLKTKTGETSKLYYALKHIKTKQLMYANAQ